MLHRAPGLVSSFELLLGEQPLFPSLSNSFFRACPRFFQGKAGSRFCNPCVFLGIPSEGCLVFKLEHLVSIAWQHGAIIAAA